MSAFAIEFGLPEFIVTIAIISAALFALWRVEKEH